MECIFYNSNQKYQSHNKVSNFIKIGRGLFMNSSLVEIWKTKIFVHVSAQYTTDSKSNQSEEYT